jgi:hypothetical protein
MKLDLISCSSRIPAQLLGVTVHGSYVRSVAHLASKNKFSVRFEVLTEDLKFQQQIHALL